jgi:CDP-glucose 4,6-dehydratase
VADGANAYLTLAEAVRSRPELYGEAFNFSNELQITALELVRRILAVMESPLEPVILDQAVNEIRHQYLSAEKARRVLGWKPLYELDSALVETVGWYRNYLRA